MISSYIHPSNKHPCLAGRPDELSKQSKVSSAAEPNLASPRSINIDFFGSGLNMISNAAEKPSNNSHEDMPEEEEEETPAEVAMLLTSVANIASKEISADPPIMNALADAFPRFPDLSSSLSDESEAAGRHHDHGEGMYYEVEHQLQQQPRESAPSLLHFDHKKTRAISIDIPEPSVLAAAQEPLLMAPPPSPPHEQEAIPTLLQWRTVRGESTSPPFQQGIFSTPPPSPLVSSRNKQHLAWMPNSEYRRSGAKHVLSSPKGRPRSVSMAEVSLPTAMIEQIPMLDLTAPGISADDAPKKLILRKKFSWKNYPELEEFLIANREEYLRHSTLNYTMQQKKYNNCLTERMLKLASEHGYTFDETEFSFVTVRDRIRCYYKSYVQSMKKRGFVIGYAARKAGLVSEEQLEVSAHTSGKIYVPRN